MFEFLISEKVNTYQQQAEVFQIKEKEKSRKKIWICSCDFTGELLTSFTTMDCRPYIMNESLRKAVPSFHNYVQDLLSLVHVMILVLLFHFVSEILSLSLFAVIQ